MVFSFFEKDVPGNNGNVFDDTLIILFKNTICTV